MQIQRIVDFWPNSTANNLLLAGITSVPNVSAETIPPVTFPWRSLRATSVLMVIILACVYMTFFVRVCERESACAYMCVCVSVRSTLCRIRMEI